MLSPPHSSCAVGLSVFLCSCPTGRLRIQSWGALAGQEIPSDSDICAQASILFHAEKGKQGAPPPPPPFLLPHDQWLHGLIFPWLLCKCEGVFIISSILLPFQGENIDSSTHQYLFLSGLCWAAPNYLSFVTCTLIKDTYHAVPKHINMTLDLGFWWKRAKTIL